MACAVTILPPQTHGYGRGGAAPCFDKHAFAGRRVKAVSAESQISFGDFNSMHIARREKQQIRRLPFPSWAADDAQLRRAVLVYLERRFYIRDAGGLTDAERLQQINDEAKRRLPRLRQHLDRYLLRYNTLAKNRAPKECLRRLGIEIQDLDSQVVALKRGIASLVTAAIFFYYRIGWNSVQIANELGIKSPCVRVWLWRIRHLAEGQKVLHRGWKPSKWAPWEIGKLRFLLELGLSHEECAAELCVVATTIQGMCKAHFPQFASVCRRNKKWTVKRIEKLKRYLVGGLSIRDVARAMHLSYGSVSFARRKYLSDLRMTERRTVRRNMRYR